MEETMRIKEEREITIDTDVNTGDSFVRDSKTGEYFILWVQRGITRIRPLATPAEEAELVALILSGKTIHKVVIARGEPYFSP